MKIFVGHGRDGAEERLQKRGVSRRDFMKFCGTVAAVMGMGPAFAPKVAEALTAKRRPSVVWLHNAECTGCSESILRTVQPYIDELILDIISLDYHETIMAAAGEAAEAALHKAVSAPDGFICVVEGGIPTKDNGIYGKVAGRTMLEYNTEIVGKAIATIAYGTCAAFGGVQAAAPNPTEAKGVHAVIPDAPVINIGGCPPNPYNLVGTIVHYLTKKSIPELDDNLRPVMFFGETVHDNCPRLKYFDNEQFALSFDSPEAKKGYCLYKLGCKGPYTYNNCPKVKFNQTNWPVEAGHPCIGCSEPNFWDDMSPFYKEAE
ncbi:MAG: hydrogenase small subunit [Desulfovibrionaceae bacterium]|nr:hydrogenase small subunit [Desulfovibrionaceae bacterium]